MMSANQGYQYQQPMPTGVPAQPGQGPAANFQYASYAAQPQFAGYEQSQAYYAGQPYDYGQAAAAVAAAAASGAPAGVQAGGQTAAGQQQVGVPQVPYSQAPSVSQSAYGGYDQAGATASYGQQPLVAPQAVPPPPPPPQSVAAPQAPSSQMSAMPQFQSPVTAYTVAGVAQHQAQAPPSSQSMQPQMPQAAAQPAGLDFQAYSAQAAMGLVQAGQQWTQPPPQMPAMMGGVAPPHMAMLAPGAAQFDQRQLMQQAAAASVLQARSPVPAAAGVAMPAGLIRPVTARAPMRGRGIQGFQGDRLGQRPPSNYSGSRQLSDLGGMDPDADRPDTVLIQGLTIEQSTHENLLENFQAAGQVKVNDKSGMPMIWIFKQQGVPTGRALVSFVEHSSAQTAISMFNGRNGWTVRLGKNSERPVIVQSNNPANNASRGGGVAGLGGVGAGGGGGGGSGGLGARGGFANGGGKMRGGRGGIVMLQQHQQQQQQPHQQQQQQLQQRPGQGGRGGDPDWLCPGCRNKNYSWRDTCNRCSASKPDNPDLVSHASAVGGVGVGRGGQAGGGGVARGGQAGLGRGGVAGNNRFTPY